MFKHTFKQLVQNYLEFNGYSHNQSAQNSSVLKIMLEIEILDMHNRNIY